MTEELIRNQEDAARLRIVNARRRLEHSKVRLANMAKLLEEIARMLRTVPSKFYELTQTARDDVDNTMAKSAVAALDYSKVAAAVNDFQEATAEFGEAIDAGLLIGVVA